MPEQRVVVPGLVKIDLVARLMEKHGLTGEEIENDIRELVRKTYRTGYTSGNASARAEHRTL